MQGFQEIFETYGADYQATMTRFMGKETMYLRVLGMLFRDENMRRLGEALGAGDKKAAFEAAHTLKGVTGNLGLTPLYEAVCRMVEPLRAGEARDDYEKLYQAVEAEFLRAEELLKNLSGEART